MRITVDIEESKLRSILKLTRQTKKSPALAQALDEFIEHRERQDFLAKVMAGKTDYSASNDELEALAHEQP
ncbi:MAG: hypothetical protein QM680_00050 [Luteolibacter sp.]